MDITSLFVGMILGIVFTIVLQRINKPYNWELIYKHTSTYIRTMGNCESKEIAYFGYLYYSKNRNKYKIKSSNPDIDDWENTRAYQGCLKKQIELQKQKK